MGSVACLIQAHLSLKCRLRYLYHPKGQIYLGDDPFILAMKSLVRKSNTLIEVPRMQRYADRPELKELFKATGCNDRNGAIIVAHLRYGYTLSEIGRHLGIHYTTASKIITASKRN